jgi:hypothetical protein
VAERGLRQISYASLSFANEILQLAADGRKWAEYDIPMPVGFARAYFF